MNIIIPMAGLGKRLRPHTLSTPKPLIKVAGHPIVHLLVERLRKSCQEEADEITFVTGRFGKTVEDALCRVADNNGAKANIVYQDEALGTAHAVLCAGAALKGPTVIAFADTLFDADFVISNECEASIWVKRVNNPESFGVVVTDQQGHVCTFVEKPPEFVSDLAIIGIYYFKNAEILRKEIQYIVDNNITKGGEYQLTDALINMQNKGVTFTTAPVSAWYDCGNKDAVVNTNTALLEQMKDQLKNDGDGLSGVQITQPVLLGKNVCIKNASVGPYVTVGDNTTIENSTVSQSLIGEGSQLNHVNIHNSMIGDCVVYDGNGRSQELSLGSWSQISGKSQ